MRLCFEQGLTPQDGMASIWGQVASVWRRMVPAEAMVAIAARMRVENCIVASLDGSGG